MTLDADAKGDAYEGLLQNNAEDVKTGAEQYFTPRPPIKAIVEVMRPEPRMTICDPACGTAGFPLAARRVTRGLRELPPPDVLAQEVAEDLGAALSQASAIAASLRPTGCEQAD
jgi:type I restriction-modification system DNA methylase subunit